ncbi:unnamed protein product, partial [Callosobruchus maculatus]
MSSIMTLKVILLLNVLIVVVVSGGPAWKEVQRGGGLKIGQGREPKNSSVSSSRGNGIKLGGSTRGVRFTTISTLSPDDEDEDEDEHVHAPTMATSNNVLHVGLVVPYKSFGTREYNKQATLAKHIVQRKLNRFKQYDVQTHI